MIYIREKLPVILVFIIAACLVILGLISAAVAQPILKPWTPHEHSGEYVTKMRPTLIGRAGVIPEAPPPPQSDIVSVEELPKLPSLADKHKEKEMRPDMSKVSSAKGLKKRRGTIENPIPNLKELALNNGELRTAEVQILLKEDKEAQQKLRWHLNPVELPVFLERINKIEPALSGQVTGTPSGTEYRFLQVRLIAKNGVVYQPINIYQNRIRVPGINIPLEDENRELEMWTMGTAKTFAQRSAITKLLKIMSFDECKALNHTLMDTMPRQCILPDGTTFLDIDKKLSDKYRDITNFDKCLHGGHPLIVDFPRKCVAPGGQVHIEPPRL